MLGMTLMQISVAPLAGARIEISIIRQTEKRRWSLPSRERGLKFLRFRRAE